MATKNRGRSEGIVWPFRSALIRGSLGMHLSITAMGINVGGFAAWLAAPMKDAILGIPIAVWIAVAAGGGTALYLSYKSVPSEVLGGGLYLVASLLLAKPFTVYVASLRTTGVERTQLLIEAAHGLLAASVIAVALVCIGWVLVRRGRRTVRRSRKEQLFDPGFGREHRPGGPDHSRNVGGGTHRGVGGRDDRSDSGGVNRSGGDQKPRGVPGRTPVAKGFRK